MRWLLACVLTITSFSALADGPVYGDIQIGAAAVSHSDLEFYPTFASVTLGAFVLPGIGLELFADTAISPGQDDVFELELASAYGAGLRLQSPPQRGVQGYIVLGAVEYTLEQNTASSLDVSGDFTGMRVSVGLLQRLERLPNVLFSAEYRHYNADEPLRVDALMIGFRLNTP